MRSQQIAKKVSVLAPVHFVVHDDVEQHVHEVPTSPGVPRVERRKDDVAMEPGRQTFQVLPCGRRTHERDATRKLWMPAERVGRELRGEVPRLDDDENALAVRDPVQAGVGDDRRLSAAGGHLGENPSAYATALDDGLEDLLLVGAEHERARVSGVEAERRARRRGICEHVAAGVTGEREAHGPPFVAFGRTRLPCRRGWHLRRPFAARWRLPAGPRR